MPNLITRAGSPNIEPITKRDLYIAQLKSRVREMMMIPPEYISAGNFTFELPPIDGLVIPRQDFKAFEELFC